MIKRTAISGLLALTLAACGGNDVPSPTERQSEQVSTGPAVEAGDVLLRTDGLTVGAEAFFYAAGQAEVETALASALGPVIERADNDECGAGPMMFTDYPGGVRAHFQDNKLVGWIVDETSDRAQVVGDVQVGTSVAEAEAADGFMMIADTTLDGEFSLGPAIGGFVDGESVTMLYAGTQCFFR